MSLVESIEALRRAGLTDPRHVAAIGVAAGRWGPSVATPYAAAAMRHPRRAAVIDHRGTIEFGRLHARSTALARGLRALGAKRGENLGLLCLNHRDFVEANIAAAKAGMPVVYLNTGFASPQLADVLQREDVRTLVCDEALLDTVTESGYDGRVVVADVESGGADRPSMHAVRQERNRFFGMLTPSISTPVLLTSGTTGTPKGARREASTPSLDTATALLQRIPYRTDDVISIACPLFHAWGLGQLLIAASLGAPTVLHRTFDADRTLALVEEHGSTALAVVPVMLQRMLAAGSLDRHDVSSLRIVASSGAALPGHLALEWMDRAGDNLYNVYGSTEVGQASVATPADLRAAPGTVGRVAPGATVSIVDDDGDPVPTGHVGRIFVGNDAQFAGYSGGGSKEMLGDLMSSGDVGRIDIDGRLFVTGRADDMIVSGGENVFPAEIDDLLLTHPDVVDAATIGVDDDEFGQRLAAYVVRRPGSGLGVAQVRSFVRDHLARHKVPRDVLFVDELPRTTTGKIRRNALHDIGSD